MNLFAVIQQLISLFLMMLIGFIVARAGIVTPDFRKRLSTFTLNTAAPCIIISSVLESDSNPLKMIGAAGMAVFFFVIMIVFSAIIVRLLRTGDRERGLDQLMLIFTNVGFMGMPVIESIYGSDGLARLSMFILMFNLFFFSYGILLIASGEKVNFKAMLNPCIVGATCGLICGTTGFHFPAIESTMASIGSMNTPLAMMIIGGSLAHGDVAAAFRNPRLYRVSFLRMLVMPLLVLLIMLPLPFDPMLIGISALLATMPIAGNCGMVANIYTPGDMTSAHATIFSTLLSAAVLPAMCALLAVVL